MNMLLNVGLTFLIGHAIEYVCNSNYNETEQCLAITKKSVLYKNVTCLTIFTCKDFGTNKYTSIRFCTKIP